MWLVMHSNTVPKPGFQTMLQGEILPDEDSKRVVVKYDIAANALFTVEMSIPETDGMIALLVEAKAKLAS